MGYTTEFNGSFTFNKEVEPWLKDYINKFSSTRRMSRDVEKIKEAYPDWEENCFMGNLGKDGAYFVGGDGFMGQGQDNSIKDYNSPGNQPSLWCQWIVTEDDTLEWDGGEKFYEYVEWLEYLISNFFEPLGYILNGKVNFQGEDIDDFGIIQVKENSVDVFYGERIFDYSDLDTDEMIRELKSRGYTVV